MSYKRKKVNIQAKIVWELHKEQPLSFTKLRERIPKKDDSTFYANLNLLLDVGIVRFVDDEVTIVKSTYALIDFKTLDEILSKMRMVFDVENPPIERIASLCKKVPENIKKELYQLGWYEPSLKDRRKFKHEDERILFYIGIYKLIGKMITNKRLNGYIDLFPNHVEKYIQAYMQRYNNVYENVQQKKKLENMLKNSSYISIRALYSP